MNLCVVQDCMQFCQKQISASVITENVTGWSFDCTTENLIQLAMEMWHFFFEFQIAIPFAFEFAFQRANKIKSTLIPRNVESENEKKYEYFDVFIFTFQLKCLQSHPCMDFFFFFIYNVHSLSTLAFIMISCSECNNKIFGCNHMHINTHTSSLHEQCKP